MEGSQEDQLDSQNIAQETPADDVFIAPSIDERRILSGESYTHHSALPEHPSTAPAQSHPHLHVPTTTRTTSKVNRPYLHLASPKQSA